MEFYASEILAVAARNGLIFSLPFNEG